MTSSEPGFRIEQFRFTKREVAKLPHYADERFSNWPVVYALNDRRYIYVGETLNASARMRQHLASTSKSSLKNMRIVLDDTFNKSACLDLESYLIKLFAGEGTYQVLNRNEGITDADYYNRAQYRATFDAIFAELRKEGLFHRSVQQIENSDLFKLSPFKALNDDQGRAVAGILDDLFEDLGSGTGSTIVIQGDPGTGKTIVAIYLMKLLLDIQSSEPGEDIEGDSLFSAFFLPGYREQLEGFRVGLVIPQQSLRTSIRDVFKKTPSLDASMVLSPFELDTHGDRFDLLIVDETHRLTQRANQPSGPQNARFTEINESLFGSDDITKTQLDWIMRMSDNQLFLVDSAQSVRPADLPEQELKRLIRTAKNAHRFYPLVSQMRVQGGSDYIDYVRAMLSPHPPTPTTFESYDLRFFDDIRSMHDAVQARDAETGLSRLVAGFAWPWVSKRKGRKHEFDIVIDGYELRWNVKPKDWISSSSPEEVGSIHTVQGYDLNYAGVIIGPDLRYDAEARRLYVDRSSYFDTKGKENNGKLGITYTDDDLLRYITNIYAVLMTRGMKGTYVYVCDPALREYLRPFFA